jgi:large subunit ribosomal protein L16
MLQPKRVKYRKVHRGKITGRAQTGNTLVSGDFGLQAQGSARLTARQIEAARRAIVHYLRRGVKLWIRVFPDKPVTKKPAETRMGRVKEEAAKEAMRLASHKLPISTKFVTKGVE